MYDVRKGLSLGAVQGFNVSVILRAIHDLGTCSRKEISQATGLDQATVTRAITQLIEDDIVEETGLAKGARGRRSISLNFSARRFRIIAVRLQRLCFSVALFDLLGNMLDKTDGVIPGEQRPEITFKAIVSAIESHLASARDDVIGIGASLPGPFLEKDERIILMTESQDWQAFDLVHEMRDHFGEVPVYANHDAKAAALTVWREKAAAYQSKVMLFISVGQGVGAGLVVNGQVFKGSQGTAGELGHTSIDVNGPRCKCGNHGCLELYTSSLALLRRIKRRLAESPGSTLNDTSSFDDVVAAYHGGDPLAVSEVERAAHYLALGITNCVNFVNPDLVIIGDEYAAFGEPFRDAVQASLTELLLPSMAANLTLRLSDIEGDLVLRGSFLDVLSQSFFSPRRFNGGENGSRAASEGSQDVQRVVP